jgi:hypothetical protein
MHIERVNTEIVRGQVDGFEDFLQGKMLAISEEHYLVWRLLHLGLDKTQQMLLVHAC